MIFKIKIKIKISSLARLQPSRRYDGLAMASLDLETIYMYIYIYLFIYIFLNFFFQVLHSHAIFTEGLAVALPDVEYKESLLILSGE
jgi:hypothetical protein